MLRKLLVAAACVAFVSAQDVTTTAAVDKSGPYPGPPQLPNPFFCPSSGTFCLWPQALQFFPKLVGFLKVSLNPIQECAAKLTQVVQIANLILQQREFQWWGAPRRLGGGQPAGAQLCFKLILALKDAAEPCIAAAIAIDTLEDTTGICQNDLQSCPLVVPETARLNIKATMNDLFGADSMSFDGYEGGLDCPFNAKQVACIAKAAAKLIAGLQAIASIEMYAIKLLIQIGQLATTPCSYPIRDPTFQWGRELNGQTGLTCLVRNCRLCQLVAALETAVTKFCLIAENLENTVFRAVQCFVKAEHPAPVPVGHP